MAEFDQTLTGTCVCVCVGKRGKNRAKSRKSKMEGVGKSNLDKWRERQKKN